MTTLREFLQLDTRDAIARIGTDVWLTAYSHDSAGIARESYFCALVPEDQLQRALSHESWDLSIGDGAPGFSGTLHDRGTPAMTYHRFGRTDGIEPLVLKRTFHSMKPAYIELLEEFRLFHELYHDRHNNRYIRILANGDDEVVAEVHEHSVRIRTRAIRQFLAAKRMRLLVFFDIVVEADMNLQDIEPEARAVTHVSESAHYRFNIADDLSRLSEKPFSRLVGKTVVAPLPIDQCGIWPYDKREREYADFIVGVDEHGTPVYHTCNPDKLANYFGKNQNAPHFLTPVVFRREVLKKYYEHPEKYEVEDGYLRCGGLWGLPLDNDAGDRVTVFLGDLGERLEHSASVSLHPRSGWSVGC